MKQTKLYPDSGVELKTFTAKHYDKLLNNMTLGKYNHFIVNAIKEMKLPADASILDLGCGTGKNAQLMLQYLSKGGKITGLDISPIMQRQFEKRFAGENRVTFKQQRIDVDFDLKEQYDIVFISFVIHGFPHEVRQTIINNVKNHLKPGGTFVIIDFAEFDMSKMPAIDRFLFKKIECKYAFDFIARDWKEILTNLGFGEFQEYLHLKNYARLLKAVKKN